MPQIIKSVFAGSAALAATAAVSNIGVQTNTVHAATQTNTNGDQVNKQSSLYDSLVQTQNSTESKVPTKAGTYSKQVNLVDETGKNVGTATLHITVNKDGSTSSSLTGKTPGYKLVDKSQMNLYPDSLTVKSDGEYTQPGTYSKTVKFVDETGKQVGTGTITKTVSADGSSQEAVRGIPYGYQIKDRKAMQNYVDQLTVTKDTSQPTMASADPWAKVPEQNSGTIKTTATAKPGDKQSNIHDFKLNDESKDLGTMAYSGKGTESLKIQLKDKDGNPITLQRDVTISDNGENKTSDENTPVTKKVILSDVTVKLGDSYTPFTTVATAGGKDVSLPSKLVMNHVGDYLATWRFGDTGFEQTVHVTEPSKADTNTSTDKGGSTTSDHTGKTTSDNTGSNTGDNKGSSATDPSGKTDNKGTDDNKGGTTNGDNVGTNTSGNTDKTTGDGKGSSAAGDNTGKSTNDDQNKNGSASDSTDKGTDKSGKTKTKGSAGKSTTAVDQKDDDSSQSSPAKDSDSNGSNQVITTSKDNGTPVTKGDVSKLPETGVEKTSKAGLTVIGSVAAASMLALGLKARKQN